MKLLVVEDDVETRDYVACGLQEQSHSIDVAMSGHDGLRAARTGVYDVLIIDRMLPGLDGLTLVKELRAGGVKSPVLFLTALGGVGDRVRGLEAGGDDYLVKPFALAELLARVNALARRPPLSDMPVVIYIGDLEVNMLKRSVLWGGHAIDLQPREFQLLEVLVRNANRVVTRTMMLEAVWNFHFDPTTNIVETHISRLRSKLGQSGLPDLIHTIRGAGYILRLPVKSS